MLVLYTGVPGSGKTLAMVTALKTLYDGWLANPGEARPLFVHNIPELKVPHQVVPMAVVEYDKAGNQMTVPDWVQIPPGALVVLDECQDVFPPRSSQTKPPPHVAWLNTHRHQGIDIWVGTQLPKLIDGNVRALVGKHRYYRRLFGRGASMVYEWDQCSDSHSGLGNAVRTLWKFPSSSFALYKSAQIHTKQTFKLPLWLLAFPISAVGLFLTVPDAIGVFSSGPPASSAAKAVIPVVGSSQAPLAAVAAKRPPETFAGYFRIGTKCFGVSKSGSTVEEPSDCAANVR